jgi:S-adenosylhomocysteine hydrolase
MNVRPVHSFVKIAQDLQIINVPNAIHFIISTKTNVCLIALINIQITILSINVFSVKPLVESAQVPQIINVYHVCLL